MGGGDRVSADDNSGYDLLEPDLDDPHRSKLIKDTRESLLFLSHPAGHIE